MDVFTCIQCGTHISAHSPHDKRCPSGFESFEPSVNWELLTKKEKMEIAISILDKFEFSSGDEAFVKRHPSEPEYSLAMDILKTL